MLGITRELSLKKNHRGGSIIKIKMNPEERTDGQSKLPLTQFPAGNKNEI